MKRCLIMKVRDNVIKCDGIILPQTEDIGIEIITTAKISNKFLLESLYISNDFPRESPHFHGSKRSPCHAKDRSGKVIDLEILSLSLIFSMSGYTSVTLCVQRARLNC